MDFLLDSVDNTSSGVNWDSRVEQANALLGELPQSQPQSGKETDITDFLIS